MNTRTVIKDTLVMLLAGGQGERLYPLTKDRAKPAVPFAGSYRLVDFTLSNCLNSGLRRIYVLTQYKSDSLNRHVRVGWDLFSRDIREYIEVLPPQQRMNADWYLGTAHAIYQNIYTLERERPRTVLVLSGDHIYRMDYAALLEAHEESDADVTVASIERPRQECAGQFGVLAVDDDLRVTGFEEKPDEPVAMPGHEDRTLCSMGVYAFRTEALVRRVMEDVRTGSRHDFARDIIPGMIERGDRVFAFPFSGYWRDVGTIDAYWDAHMDLTRVLPEFNLYDEHWPLRGRARCRPPGKSVLGGGAAGTPCTEIHNSLVCNGAIISGARVCDSVIGHDVRIEVGACIERSVLLDGVKIGRGVIVRNAIVDKHNTVPDNARLGVNPDWDAHHFTVSDGGIVVMAKRSPFPHFDSEVTK
jgi:glucose-1-phosphate adenylyltransferase